MRIEGHLVPQQTRRKKKRFNATGEHFALHTGNSSPEVHSSSEIQLNFLHNNFQFCHINAKARSSSFDLNDSQIENAKTVKVREKCLPTSWSLSLTL